MAIHNPYDPKDDRRRAEQQRRRGRLDALVNGTVDLGLNVSATVLSGIADALDSVGAAMDRRAQAESDTFAVYRRRLDGSLAKRYSGWLTMGVLGWVFGASFAVAALVFAILLAAGSHREAASVFTVLLAVFSACAVSLGAMGYVGCRNAGYFSRLRKYLRGARGFTVPVKELAKACLLRFGQVRRDLSKAVSSGDLPNACLDRGGETLYLDGTLCADTPQEEPAAPRTDAQSFQQEGREFLAYLQACQGRLDPQTDEELRTMSRNCAAVLGFVGAHPNQLPRVRRFREYYLPTTRKLLDTACGLGEADTGSAREIRRDITGILHTLNTAYGKLYDTLLQEVGMDVSTEIDALEAMLGQDGLTRGFDEDFGPRR